MQFIRNRQYKVKYGKPFGITKKNIKPVKKLNL